MHVVITYSIANVYNIICAYTAIYNFTNAVKIHNNNNNYEML